jgi:hypothetical protein
MVEGSRMQDVGNGYLVIGVGLGMALCIGLGFVVWMLAAIAAICDEGEGVRDA